VEQVQPHHNCHPVNLEEHHQRKGDLDLVLVVQHLRLSQHLVNLEQVALVEA
jgi:hypothetical protein